MHRIRIEVIDDETFQVSVTDATGRTEHRVHVSEDERSRIGGEASVETLLDESFGFLLEREPKEAILGEFDLSLIGHYFPEYEGVIRERLARLV